MFLVAKTVDNYKGFQYVIPQRLGAHQNPYVKVLSNNTGVAYILLKNREIVFYENTSNEVRKQIDTLKTWIDKNIRLCVKVWNKNNEVKI